MVDRTLLTSACLVVISFLFFAGTALTLMQLQNPGGTNPTDFSKMNNGNLKQIPQGTNAWMNVGPGDNQEDRSGMMPFPGQTGPDRSSSSRQDHLQKDAPGKDDTKNTFTYRGSESSGVRPCQGPTCPDCSSSSHQGCLQKDAPGKDDNKEFFGNERPEKPSNHNRFQFDDKSSELFG